MINVLMILADVKVGRVNGEKDFQGDSLAQRVNTVDRNVAIAKALLYHLPEHSTSTTPATTATTATTAVAATAMLSSSNTTVSSSSSGSHDTASASATTSTDTSGDNDTAQHGLRRSVLPRALCFCASVQHATDLAATLNDHGKFV
jgi:hypothetical protein